IMQAVTNGDDKESLTLLELLASLRRAEWTETTIRNCFRNKSLARSFSDDLINVMAKRLGQKPLPNPDVESYERRDEIRREIVDAYFHQFPDQKLAATLIAQSDSFQTEVKLRDLLRDKNYKAQMWSWVFCSGAGYLAATMLSFFAVVFGTEMVA